MVFNVFNEIKQRANIEEICEYYGVHLDSRHKAICPFFDHKEKTASFSVLPKKNIFFCFGCGKKGDVINLVRYLNNCSAFEAARKINDICHCGIDFEDDKYMPKFQTAKELAYYRKIQEEEKQKDMEMKQVCQTLYQKACEVYQKWYKLYQKTKTWDIDEEGLSDIYKNECYFDGLVDFIRNSEQEEIYEIKDELYNVIERGII